MTSASRRSRARASPPSAFPRSAAAASWGRCRRSSVLRPRRPPRSFRRGRGPARMRRTPSGPCRARWRPAGRPPRRTWMGAGAAASPRLHSASCLHLVRRPDGDALVRPDGWPRRAYAPRQRTSRRVGHRGANQVACGTDLVDPSISAETRSPQRPARSILQARERGRGSGVAHARSMRPPRGVVPGDVARDGPLATRPGAPANPSPSPLPLPYHHHAHARCPPPAAAARRRGRMAPAAGDDGAVARTGGVRSSQ